MQNKSPIYDVIKELVGDKYEIYSYQNEANFKNLWEFNSSSDTKTMIVVWDGIPEKTLSSVVDTSKYLTPIDWAVGYSLSIKKRIEQNTYPDLRILIFDDGSQSVSFSDSLKFVYQYCNKEIVSMPWIRIFSDMAAFSRTLNDLDPNVSKSSNQSEEDKMPKPWWKRIFSAKAPASVRDIEIREEVLLSMKEAFDKKTCDLDSIKGIWAASLTRPSIQGDHHAIANLVGPLLLIKEEGDDLHVDALQGLMGSIGLLPEKDENNDALLTKGNPWISWNPHKSRLKQLKLILIDDMFQMGWGKILCLATGVDYKEPSKDDGKDKLVKISECNAGENEKFIVKATSSANWILKKLETLTSTDNRFEFSLDDSVACPEILFLDLRLYSGGNFKDEVAFFSELIKIAKKFEERQNKNLSWPGFSGGEKGEIKRIENWINKNNKKQEDPEYVEALTLLPRILALTDLSLPIILFSSTGRRDITEKLKPYRNIITVFEKPRFTVDIPVDIANQTKIKFKNAMERALSILAGRQICRKVKELANSAGSCVEMIPAQANIPGFKHIEIYIDEFGGVNDKQFSVVGLIIVYPEYSKVNELSEELKNAGYSWYSVAEDDKSHLSKEPGLQNENYRGSCAKVDWNYDRARDKLLELTGSKNIFISAICVQDNKDNYANPVNKHILLKDIQGDERYKRTLSVLLELAIYEYIPELLKCKKNKGTTTLSIFAGTRIAPVHWIEAMFASHNPDDYFGYGYAPKPNYYYTFSQNSVCPIVANILRSRNDLHVNLTLHHVRGISLQYGVPTDKGNNPIFITKYNDNRASFYVRTQHYFADHIFKKDNNKLYYKDEFNSGFYTQSDTDLHNLLDAQRKILDGDIAQGVVLACECTDTSSSKDKMHGHLTKKIEKSLNPDVFGGFDFLNVCEAVEGDPTIVGELSVSENSKIDKALEADRTKEGGEVDQVVKGGRDDNAVNVVNSQASGITVKDGFDFLNVCEAVEGDPTIVGELSVSENSKIDKALEADRTKEGGEVDQIVKGGRDDNAVNVVNPQISGITVRVEQIKKKNGIIKHYVCRETTGEGRRILITQQKKKDSGITNAIEEGNFFDVSIYTQDNTLYGYNLRRSEVR